jgi:hypothetical protein
LKGLIRNLFVASLIIESLDCGLAPSNPPSTSSTGLIAFKEFFPATKMQNAIKVVKMYLIFIVLALIKINFFYE